MHITACYATYRQNQFLVVLISHAYDPKCKPLEDILNGMTSQFIPRIRTDSPRISSLFSSVENKGQAKPRQRESNKSLESICHMTHKSKCPHTTTTEKLPQVHVQIQKCFPVQVFFFFFQRMLNNRNQHYITYESMIKSKKPQSPHLGPAHSTWNKRLLQLQTEQAASLILLQHWQHLGPH